MLKFLTQFFLVSIIFCPYVVAVEAFCFRDVTGSLVCEKTLEMIPESYRAKAFFRDVPAKNVQNQDMTNSRTRETTVIPQPQNLESQTQRGTYGLPPAQTDNLPSRSHSNVSNLDSFSNNQPSSLLKKDPLVNKNKDAKIQIFVAKWCAHCKALESFLRREQIQFAKFDVEEDEYGKSVYESEGSGIPITKIGSNTIVGFEEKKFKALVESYKPY